jgi:hypothetical protein
VDLDDRVLLARVIKNALGGRRLSGVDVGDDSDVADVGKRRSAGHGKVPLRFRKLGAEMTGCPGISRRG